MGGCGRDGAHFGLGSMAGADGFEPFCVSTTRARPHKIYRTANIYRKYIHSIMYDELHIQNGTLHVQNTIYVLPRADYAYANRNVHCDKIILNNCSSIFFQLHKLSK